MTNLVQSTHGRDFPYATLSINVLACFLMGFLFEETLERLTISPVLRLGILTGFLGGFSTFSTFAMETLLPAEHPPSRVGEIGLDQRIGDAGNGHRLDRKPKKGRQPLERCNVRVGKPALPVGHPASVKAVHLADHPRLRRSD
jgi:hypothetical protein